MKCYLNKAIGYQLLVFEFYSVIFDKIHDGMIIHQDATLASRTLNALTGTFINDLSGQVFGPTRLAVKMPALQPPLIL